MHSNSFFLHQSSTQSSLSPSLVHHPKLCIMQQQYIMQRQALIQRLEADQRMMLRVLQTSMMPSSHRIPYASNSDSTNVGDLPRIYRPTAPQSDVTSMILDVMTSEDGSSRLQRLLLGQVTLVDPIDLVRYITRDGHVLTIAAKDEYGIESVKVFVDFVKQYPCLFNWVTSALEENVVELMLHPTASKLILHCLGTLSYRQKLFLFDAATKKCLKLGKNAIGRVILEECINSSRDSQQRKILDRLVYHASTLSKTSKGNLVIQFALKIGDRQFDREICRVSKNQLEDLSTDENGSYVIEACLKSSAGEVLVRKLVEFDSDKLERLVTDRYANFIIQSALKISKGTSLYNDLVRAIRRLPEELEENFYARKVLWCIESLEQESKNR